MKSSAHHLPAQTYRDTRRGSALLITVLMMSLLLLAVTAFTAQVRTELSNLRETQRQWMAERNAMLAVDLAIGALQSLAGPDQRVTARADLALPPGLNIVPDSFNLTTGDMIAPGTSGANAAATVDAYWAGAAANRHWVGVYRNRNTSSYDPARPVAFNATPELLGWLVSGNEQNPAAFSPHDRINGLSPGATPETSLQDPLARPHQLLVKAAAGVIDAASLDRSVTAPLLPLHTPADLTARYAWWVGDEGIKARVNLVDPYAGEDRESAHPSNTARRQSAQRTAPETVNGLGGLYTPNQAGLLRPFGFPQMGFLHADSQFRRVLAERYHDLSLVSRGVLANAKHGGLKGDLTYILSRGTASEFRDALTQAFFGAPVVPLTSGNVALSPAASVYAEIPTTLASSYTAIYEAPANHYVMDVPATLMDESATWEQLWSHYHLGRGTGDNPAGVFIDANTVQARLASMTQTALTPLVVQGKVFYRMRNEGGKLVVDMNPLVVLANPYPFTLRGEFILQFLMGVEVRWADLGLTANPTETDLNTALSPSSAVLSNALPSNAGFGNVRLVAKADGIPPGQAQIFTADPDADLRVAHATTDTHEVPLLPTYDPSVFLTYESTRSMPAGTNVWVGLRTGTQMHLRAYMGSVQTPNQFLFIFNQGSTAYSTATGLDTNVITSGSAIINSFRVYPMPWVDGEKRGGGGVAFTLHDAYNRTSAQSQQSPFLGINYRTMKVMYQGNSTYHHPLEWSISYGFRGTRDQPYDDLPLDYYDANLLLPPGVPGIPNTTRWGLVNTGGLPSYNVPPPGIDGLSDTALVNVLYDLPSPDQFPTSLGQLQHFNLAGTPNASAGGSSPQSWQLNYPIANSYITPRVPRDLLFYRTSTLGSHYDGAWLWNELLWDRFAFSSFPPEGPFDFGQPSGRLVNARYRPFRPQVPQNDASRYRGVHLPAENLLVDGAFNINSTSIEAWKAVLAGLRDVPTGSERDPTRLTAPFARVLHPLGAARDAETGNTPNAWNGVRNLSDAELQALAEEIVLQVQLRGPFLSLGDFVNRQLTPGRTSRIAPAPADTFRLGLTGALQAALDRVINLPTHLPDTPTGNSGTFRDKTRAWYTSNGNGPHYGDVEHRTPTRISGFPGFLLQGDLLSALGPTLSPRSDTFTIRAYGEVSSSLSPGTPTRVWCEATVQRQPDFLDPENPADAAPATLTMLNTRFGRRFEILNLRWLTEAER